MLDVENSAFIQSLHRSIFRSVFTKPRMSYCLNPACTAPQQAGELKHCQNCGATLHLQNRYCALKPIGQGGFGRTFLAVDCSSLEKLPCVIKQFLSQQQGTANLEKASELFRQEALRLHKLGKHPQIPYLLNYLEQDGQQYLIQQFIDGRDLEQELTEEGEFNEAKIRYLLGDLLPVLQFIHDHRVIHRDIKPANIIRRSADQKLFLVDLGAAKYATGTALVQTGTVIGSAEYTAPEQSRGKAVFASDLYSLGVTCIHLMTGMSPFDLFDSGDGNWVWKDYLRQPMSDSLAAILTGLLETATNHRYQAADEVLADLETDPDRLLIRARLEPEPFESESRSPVKKRKSRPIPIWTEDFAEEPIVKKRKSEPIWAEDFEEFPKRRARWMVNDEAGGAIAPINHARNLRSTRVSTKEIIVDENEPGPLLKQEPTRGHAAFLMAAVLITFFFLLMARMQPPPPGDIFIQPLPDTNASHYP